MASVPSVILAPETQQQWLPGVELGEMSDGGRVPWQRGMGATFLMPPFYPRAARGGPWNGDHNVSHGRRRMKEMGILVNF